MGIEDLISWYQKKIGTYDKQQWEKTIEQRILFGLNHIQFKSAKPKTDLIDLDLFRGSSFTKAKPKHSLVTVVRLSTLRYIFLPLYSKWWVRQTSGKIFCILLLLYLLQLFNIGVYSYNTSKSIDVTSQPIPKSEICVPIVMMWVLSFIHSQIVETIPGPELTKLSTTYHHKSSYRRVHRKSRKNSVTLDTEVSNEQNIKVRNRRKNRIVWKNILATSLEESHSKIERQDPNIAGPSHKNNVQIDAKNKSVVAGANNNVSRLSNGQPLDDDGFESLNGNVSSHSDEPTVPNKTSRKVSVPKKEDKQSVSGLSRCNKWVKEVQESKRKLHRRQSAPDLRFSSADLDTDSDTDTHITVLKTQPSLLKRRTSQKPSLKKAHFEITTCDTDEEGECETLSSPETIASGQMEGVISSTEWIGVTTNSDDCSYSSEFSESDDNAAFDVGTPTSILSPCCVPSDKVSCTIWDRKEIKKAELSVFEISSLIIGRVEKMRESMDYFYFGIFISTTLSILPISCRFCNAAIDTSSASDMQLSVSDIPDLIISKFSTSLTEVLDAVLGNKIWERSVMLTASFQRFVLGFLLFFLLVVAERSFKQRFLYAKLFSHLTSSRKARQSDLPHFRLNKVRNIKTWLSVRSYLRKRGPQRSIDVIVSTTFIIFLMLLSLLCMDLLQDTIAINSQYNLEMMIWSIGLGILIMRFMTLGVNINKKYRNLSVLITEQINLYLQIEQKPKKKDELMVANSVLKLAADLLKELESQFKILGLSVNPLLYNFTKVVILSALSGVLSEVLGFKLKLHKIKIK